MLSIENADIRKGEVFLLRSSLDVPILNGEIIDDTRLKNSLETIRFLIDKDAKIIIIGHIGREGETLLPVSKWFQNNSVKHFFAKDIEEAKGGIADNDIVLLENIRSFVGEEKNDEEFSKTLASLGESFVFDAFSVAHRSHSSVIGVCNRIKCYSGIRFTKEIDVLKKAMKQKSLIFLGGAKLKTKFPILVKLLEKGFSVFVGGVLANSIFKANGYEVGESKTEDIVPKGFSHKNLILPKEVITQTGEKKGIEDISSSDSIFDVVVGKEVDEEIENVPNIIWNGPLGFYEKGFCESSKEIIAKVEGKYLLLGGGDAVASIAESDLSKVDFISDGGGAMLTFLSSSLVFLDECGK